MKIVEIIKDSWQEYHPYQSLVLFSFGCNLKCPRCYNLKQINDSSTIIGDAIPLLEKHLNPMHEAVVFLGGEPTVWGEDLIESARFVKEKNLKTKVYTNGLYPKVIKELLDKNLIDAWSIDIKTVEPNILQVLGVPVNLQKYLSLINESIELIKNSNTDLELRTTAWAEVDVEKVQEYTKKYYSEFNHIIAKDFLENAYINL